MSSLPTSLFIGGWRVDPGLDRISCDGREIKLEPRAMRLLLYLAAHAGRNVTVAELLENVWPDVIVGPDSVYQAISLLRRSFGDDQNRPTYIARIPRKGYRLIASVSTAAQPEISSAVAPAVSAAPVEAPVEAPTAARVAPERLWNRFRYSRIAAAVVAAAILAMGVFYSLVKMTPQNAQLSAGVVDLPKNATPPALAISRSIAVLPFLDLTENKDMGYFADGLSEELIDVLARNTDFHVPARTSSFYFKDRQATVADIGRKLNVDNVLEGSVRRSGNRIRVTAQLVRADSGYHLWSNTYDRDLDDVFSVEDDIARSVAGVLQAKVPAGPAVNPPQTYRAAHILFMQCIFFMQRNTEPDSDKAVACFQKLLAVDSGDAQVWSSYAIALLKRSRIKDLTQEARRGGITDALHAAQHALQLDPSLAQAHTVVATYHRVIGRNWQAANAELQMALDIDPTDPTALLAAANLARELGHIDQAIEYCERAKVRDPLNFQPYARLGQIYLSQGKLVEAEAATRERLDLAPDGNGGRAQLTAVLLARGDFQNALSSAEEEPNEEMRLISLALVYHSLGRRADSDAATAQLIQKYAEHFPIEIAGVFAFRGENDRAFGFLDRAFLAQDPGLFDIKIEPYFKGIREDPRWGGLLKKVGLQ